MNTQASEVFDSFESSFQDKKVIPESLEMIWLLKAIGQYSVELDKLNFDKDLMEFDCELDRYVIDTLGMMMKKYYQERQVSLVNKRVAIVTKDLSYDGTNGAKTAEKSHLDYVTGELEQMLDNQKPTAYN